MIRWIERIGTGLACAGMIWILASWFDVMAHNTSDYVYAAWNLFRLVF